MPADRHTIFANMKTAFTVDDSQWQASLIARYSDIVQNDALVDVVIFGSVAIDAADAESDVDVLLVGNVIRELDGSFDAVWTTREYLESSDWLASELGCHIARYGVWLKGNDDWRHDALSGEVAVHQKAKTIRRQVARVMSSVGRLHPAYLTKHFTILRRSIQRLGHLENRVAVPPRFVLDSMWQNMVQSKDPLGRLLAVTAIDSTIKDEFRQLAKLVERHYGFVGTLSIRRYSARGSGM